MRFIISKGIISAIDGICPHQGGPLAEGLLEGTTVTCPWHGWQFDVCTGKTPLGPKIKQPVYEVKVEGQDVLVAGALKWSFIPDSTRGWPLRSMLRRIRYRLHRSQDQ